MDQFIDEHDLLRAWKTFPVDYTHSLDIEGKTFTSTIDHFHWNNGLTECIEDVGVLYLPDNTSDHCPIYCTILANSFKAQSRVATPSTGKPSWRKATTEEKIAFNKDLANQLEILPAFPDCCDNVHCVDATHLHSTDDQLTNLLDCLSSAASDNLPFSTAASKTNSRKKDRIPHRKEDIEPH